MRRILRIFKPFMFITGALTCAGVLASSPSFSQSEGTAILQCTVVDASGGAILPARCSVVDASGINRFPPIETSFYHSAGYFFTSGSFSCTVSLGSVVVRVKHGFEFREYTGSISVQADTSIVIALERIVSMDSLEWYSGDTHVHINHAGGDYVLEPADARFMAEAEDLNIVNCLDNDYFFTGASDVCSTPECIVFMSEEMRSSCYGHLGLLGLPSLVSPVSAAWWPLEMDVADSAHARDGSLVVAAHPVSSEDFMGVESWPANGIARELPVDCIAGRIDAMDILSYSNCHHGGIETDLWYRLLNCGFHIPACAGTDAPMNRMDSYPLGAFRTYVRIPEGGLSAERWFDELASGATFVTNGPLFTSFKVGGQDPGDSLWFAQPGAEVSVEISVESVHPIDRIEIMRNAAPEVTLRLEPPRSSVDTSVSLVVDESSWIAARVHGAKRGWLMAGDSLFAHTSPVYVVIDDQQILEREDLEFFVWWIDDLELLAALKGQWADTAQSSRVFRDLAAARAWYVERAFESPADAGGERSQTPSALQCENAPNPFGNGTMISFNVPGYSGRSVAGSGTGVSQSSVSLAIYDVSGRLVRRLIHAALPAGSYRIAWDGRDERGRDAASGIYFAKVSMVGRSVTRKLVLVH